MTGPTAVDEDDDAPVRAGTSSLDSDADIVVVVVNAVTALVAAVVVDGKLDGGIEFDDVDEDEASIICFIGRARRRIFTVPYEQLNYSYRCMCHAT